MRMHSQIIHWGASGIKQSRSSKKPNKKRKGKKAKSTTTTRSASITKGEKRKIVASPAYTYASTNDSTLHN